MWMKHLNERKYKTLNYPKTGALGKNLSHIVE